MSARIKRVLQNATQVSLQYARRHTPRNKLPETDLEWWKNLGVEYTLSARAYLIRDRLQCALEALMHRR